LLIAGEHPRVVADMMGHTTSAITERLYQKVAPRLKQEATTKLDSLIRSADPTPG